MIYDFISCNAFIFDPINYNALILYLIISYFIGSIPFGIVFAKLFKTGDLQKLGSKNIGATNALRVGGKKMGILTLLADFFKGYLLIYLSSFFLKDTQISVDLQHVFIGVFSVLGHVFSIFLKGRGGKGVATALGTICALSPTLFIISLFLWGGLFFRSKTSSLSSIGVFILLPFLFLFYEDRSLSVLIYFIFLSALIIYTHKDNIFRLWNGLEDKIKY